MNHNRNNHPEHPVRDAFYCVWCVFFSLAFNFLWVRKLFDFEYADHAFLLAVLILAVALICAIVALKNAYVSHRRNKRNRMSNRGNERYNNHGGSRDNDRFNNRHNGNRHGNDRNRYNGNRYDNDRNRHNGNRYDNDRNRYGRI